MLIGSKVKHKCKCNGDIIGIILKISDAQAFVKWLLLNGKEYTAVSDIKNLEIVNDSNN